MTTLNLFERDAISDVKPTKLRKYQSEAIQWARDQVRAGMKRILLVGPVAAGKMRIVASTIQTSSVPALFVANREELINQCCDQLRGLGITNIGVMRGDDDRTDAIASTQVASIQTLARRKKPVAGLVFVDECHRAMSDSYQEHVFDHYIDSIILGFTATPTRLDGRPLGHSFQVMKVFATYAELIKLGFIVAPECYDGGPDNPNLANVGMAGGDYDETQLAGVMRETKLIGGLLDHWQRLANKYPKPDGTIGLVEGPYRRTLIFAVNIAHSHDICERFAKAGVRIAHLDGNTKDSERVRTIKAIGDGEIDAISNVNILCLDEQTEILTSEGWTGIDVMRPDHLVANWENGGKVTFEAPLEVIRRDRAPEEQMVSVHGERLNARVTEGHWMLYRTAPRPDAPFLKCHARDLVGRQVRLPMSGRSEPITITVDQVDVNERHKTMSTSRRSRLITSAAYDLRKLHGWEYETSHIEAARRVDRKLDLRRKSPHELTVDECRFIGFWIGDGCRARPKSGGLWYSVSQSEAYPKIVAWVDALIARIGIDVKRMTISPAKGTINRSITWSIPRGTGAGSQERVGIFSIENYLDKSGSQLLWGLNEEQFDSFVEGFWLADGDHGDGTPKPPTRSMALHNTNKRLLDTIQAIATVRGYGCSLRAATLQNPKNKQLYTLRLKKREAFFVGRDRFKIEPNWKPERVWCVRVRTKNIITRRGGSILVMGNCEGTDIPSAKCIAHARPTQSLVLARQTSGRIMRPWHPGCPPGCMEHPSIQPLFLDHAGIIANHGFPFEDIHWELNAKPRRFEKRIKLKLCKACFAYIPPARMLCPYCGGDCSAPDPEEEKQKQIQETKDQLVRRSTTPEDMKRAFFDNMVKVARHKGNKPGFASAKYKEHYGAWPPWDWSEQVKASFACDPEWQAALEKKQMEKEARAAAKQAEEIDAAERAAIEEEAPLEAERAAYEAEEKRMAAEKIAADEEAPFDTWLKDELE